MAEGIFPLWLTGGGRRGLVDGRIMPTMNHNLQRWLVLTLAVASLLPVPAWAQGQPGASEMSPEIAEMLSTNPPPKGFKTRLDYIRSFTSYAAIDKAYRSAKISKEEAMLAMELNPVAPSDKTPLDIYGKVIDQNGQPVAGAKVRGDLEFEMADDVEHDTKTDVQGRFHFLGLHGQGLGISVEKAGYEFNLNMKFAVFRPSHYLPDPDNPLIVRMWKLRGGEPLMHTQIYSSVSCDGSTQRFDLLSNQQKNTGDLVVMLTRNPLTLNSRNRHKSFDWSVTLAITNGGLLESTNQPYPYEAPAEGYQPSITFNFPTNMAGWQYELKRDYYFKSQDGKAYGRMTIDIDASRPQPPTYFNADIWVNPGGSRNLEYDPNKQIIR